jgi:AcrR family transcriptional regulator
MATLSSKAAETKYRILRVAADLFCSQGVHATRPEEIIEAAGVGKGQFYHYFKSKEGLVHEVLLWYFETLRSGNSPIVSHVGSWSDLEAWFSAHIEFQKGFGMTRSCIFGTIANEITDGDEVIRRDIARIFDFMHARLANFFSNEKSHGRLSQDADESALANFCIAAIQGAMLIGKLRRDSKAAEAIVREALTDLRRFVAA